MCDAKSKCQEPENLKIKPEECSLEQIRQCHVGVEAHPCTEETGRSNGFFCQKS